MVNKKSEDIQKTINDFQEIKKKKIENDELIKTLMNFSILFLILALLPLLPNIQTAQIILPTVFAFSPSLALAYFVAVLILYKYYEWKEKKTSK
ncbi:MAG: hypothetical protein QW197_02975 [Candidatus Aenigmatarchaeota archaeon]